MTINIIGFFMKKLLLALTVISVPLTVNAAPKKNYF